MTYAIQQISRRLRWTVLAAAVALSACGGGGGGDDTASAGSGAPASGSSQQASCVNYINTGFDGNINATYADGWGGMPQSGVVYCGSTNVTQGADGGGGGGGGIGGGAGGSGGSGGGGSGGGGASGGGGGEGGAGAGGGEGKVVNALMTVTRLSDGVELGSAMTDSVHGLVTIRPRASDGPVLLTLTGRPGAQYYDEGLDRMVDFDSGRVLHALVDRFDENVGVTPLTEAAYRYALENFRAPGTSAQSAGSASLRGITATQIRTANETVRAGFNANLDADLQLESVKSLPTPIDSSSPVNALPDNRYGKAATVMGGLVKAAAKRRPEVEAPALGVTEQIAADLKDGTVDGTVPSSAPGTPGATPAPSGAYYDRATLRTELRAGADEIKNRFGRSDQGSSSGSGNSGNGNSGSGNSGNGNSGSGSTGGGGTGTTGTGTTGTGTTGTGTTGTGTTGTGTTGIGTTGTGTTGTGTTGTGTTGTGTTGTGTTGTGTTGTGTTGTGTTGTGTTGTGTTGTGTTGTGTTGTGTTGTGTATAGT